MSLLGRLRRFRRGRALPEPVIVEPTGTLTPRDGGPVVIILCSPGFDQRVPNAGTMIRNGWARGFEQLGVPYWLVSVRDVARVVADVPQAIVLLTGGDTEHLDRGGLTALRATRTLVWVNTWFPRDRRFWRESGFPDQSGSDEMRRRVLALEPRAAFTISPESRFEYYAEWVRQGLRLVSLPLACDDTLYRPDTHPSARFASVDIAFVGGYWPYKARSFERYLRPYEERLTIFGYSPWPYGGYGGQLDVKLEPVLYRQARLVPTVNEPHAAGLGIDLNERVFKVLGSGGATVTDVAPAYREWFSADELLVPESEADYHSIVNEMLTDMTFNASRRRAGLAAVLARHCYRHRAARVLDLFQVPHPMREV